MTSLSHTTPTAPVPSTLRRPRVWAWPLAIILGFPVGGYVANLTVGAVDSVGTALAGGLIAGARGRRRAMARAPAGRPLDLDRSDQRRNGRRAHPRRRHSSTTGSAG